MGKGDRKTRRGKIIRGSYGVTRPRKKYYYEEVSETSKEEKAKK